MLEENTRFLNEYIPESWRVLDVGGWYAPYARADAVVDLLDYDSRGLGTSNAPQDERFSSATWVRQDISKGLPFSDGEFDFAVCSHTLEDVRDPISVCSEIMRVARRGYIEVPSRVAESIRGLEGRNYVGHYHHRWLVEIEQDVITFRFKAHAIHEDRRYHLPRRLLKRLAPHQLVDWMVWDGKFTAEEIIQISHIGTRMELAEFVNTILPLNILERSSLALTAPLRTRQYGLSTVLRHPLSTHVARDPAPASDFWLHLPEIHSELT